MDLHSLISHQSRRHLSLRKNNCLSFWSPACHPLVVTSVSVCLPPSLHPEPCMSRSRGDLSLGVPASFFPLEPCMSRSRGDLSLCVPAAILLSGSYRVPAHIGRLMEGRSGSLLRKWGGGGKGRGAHSV